MYLLIFKMEGQVCGFMIIYLTVFLRHYGHKNLNQSFKNLIHSLYFNFILILLLFFWGGA